MKKQAVIFFPNHHLAYSPTTINLYKLLQAKFNVKIIAPYPSLFNNSELPNVNVEYFIDEPTSLFAKLEAMFRFSLQLILSFFSGKKNVYSYAIAKALIKYDRIFKRASVVHQNDHIIVIDFLFLKLASKYFSKINFVSLELTDNLIPLVNTIDEKRINAVVIQSKERYDYVFGDKKLNTFFVQNSVVYDPSQLSNSKVQNTIIFNGTASATFGFFYFLDFLLEYGNQFQGIVKGAILPNIKSEIQSKYSSLLHEQKLVLDDGYIDNDDLVNYVSKYEVGVCFYDMDQINHNRFNYLSAPSGKMFTYFASGVPIIASNISGLKIIEEYKAGVLINDYKPQTILEALLKIKQNYQQYSTNCLAAALHFSFDRHAKSFVDFLE